MNVSYRRWHQGSVLGTYATATSRDEEDGEGISGIENSLSKSLEARKQAILSGKGTHIVYCQPLEEAEYL